MKLKRVFLTTSLGLALVLNGTYTRSLQGQSVNSSPNTNACPSQDQLVAEGERLFFHETFNGNGRTCGTCHPAENNLTLDPQFIAGLPPTNPLFVAEFNPALKDLERIPLLRQFAVILENVDGFDQPGVLRGVPHVLSLRTTVILDLTSVAATVFGLTNSTGWSADGAPGNGALRNFATGAVRQHFTKRTNRVENVDFRLPTDAELDALLAFMLSLGRQEVPPDLSTLTFKSPVVEQGKTLFNNPNVGGKCVRCHFGGGANNAKQFNTIANTGVERLPSQPVRLAAAALGNFVPVDGGLGRLPFICADSGGTGIGNCQFRAPPLIEAANTPPFFHNNSVNTIEAAVNFFNSQAFNEVTGITNGIHLEATEVVAVASLLRTLNALESIRNSNFLETQVLCATLPKDGDKQLQNESTARKLTMAWRATRDAIDVLEGGQYLLFDGATMQLRQALSDEEDAFSTSSVPKRNRLLNEAINLKTAARGLIVE